MNWTQTSTAIEQVVYVQTCTKDLKDTIEVMAANGGALGLTLIQCNEILQFISLSLAIAFTIYKFIKKKK